MKKKDIVIGNFLGGMAWGVGTVIGATVIAAILIGVFSALGYIPFFGEPFRIVVEQVNQTRTPFRK